MTPECLGFIADVESEISLYARMAKNGHLPGPRSMLRLLARCRFLVILFSVCVVVLAVLKLWTLTALLGVSATPLMVVWVYVAGHIGGYRHAAALVTKEAIQAEQLPPEADQNAWHDLPPAIDHHGYLYVIRFHSGVVKVGQTFNPRRRMAEHRRDSWSYGVVMTDVWVSSAHADYLDNETKLIMFAASLADRSRREYFHGADYTKLVEFARGLVPTPL